MTADRLENLRKAAQACGGCPIRLSGQEVAWLLRGLEKGDQMAGLLESIAECDRDALRELEAAGIVTANVSKEFAVKAESGARDWRMWRVGGAVAGRMRFDAKKKFGAAAAGGEK